MIVIQSLFILFYFFVFLIYYLTKVVQGERKTKRKRSFQNCFSEPQPTLREAKIVQGERKTKRKRVKPPWRWLEVRGSGLDTLTNNQYPITAAKPYFSLYFYLFFNFFLNIFCCLFRKTYICREKQNLNIFNYE